MKAIYVPVGESLAKGIDLISATTDAWRISVKSKGAIDAEAVVAMDGTTIVGVFKLVEPKYKEKGQGRKILLIDETPILKNLYGTQTKYPSYGGVRYGDI